MSGRRHELPAELGAEIAAELVRLGRSPSGGALEVAAVWRESVGAAVAANAWPARVSRDGTLIVHAASSTWAFELTQLEGEIRARLGPAAPPRLAFVVGPLPSEGHETAPEAQRVVREPGPAERARAAELAFRIEAPGLREAVARAAAASLAAAGSPAGTTGSSGKLESG